MASKKARRGVRVTVEFNVKDLGWLNAEAKRRTAEAGYKVTRSHVLRDIVRDKWSPAG